MNDKLLQDIVDIELQRLGGGAPIQATVHDGLVTLTGVVETDGRRILIEQELLRRPEVLDVRNHLHVAPPPGDARNQLLTLLAREGMATDGMTIEEEDGVVRLSGEAGSWFDREAAERLAWTLPGVRDVVSRMTLPPGAVEPDLESETVEP